MANKIGYKTKPNKDMDRRPKRKKSNGGYAGCIHNHPSYEGDLTLSMIHFYDSKGNIRACMDVELEELYVVPTPNEDTHSVFSSICERENVPYIDQAQEFAIAVPITFYASLAQQTGLTEEYEKTKLLEKLLWRKWTEMKDRPAKLQEH